MFISFINPFAYIYYDMKTGEVVRGLITKNQFDAGDGRNFSRLPVHEKRNVLRLLPLSESLALFSISPKRKKIVDEVHMIADREQRFADSSDGERIARSLRFTALVMGEIEYFLDPKSRSVLERNGIDPEQVAKEYIENSEKARSIVLKELQCDFGTNDEFFGMLGTGRLLNELNSIRRGKIVSIRYLEGVLGAFRLRMPDASYYAKSSDPRPEIPAVEYLGFVGIPTAAIHAGGEGHPYRYRNSGGLLQRYQIQEDMRAYENGELGRLLAANELHTLANQSDEYREQRIRLLEAFSDMKKFFRELGSTYCALAMGGFFDRHTNNMWLMEFENGFRFGSADLDTFCCYQAEFDESGMSLSNHLSKLSHEIYETFVRLTLQINRYRLNCGDEKLMSVHDVIEVAYGFESGPFIRGVAEMAGRAAEIGEKMEELVTRNDGIPIGVAQAMGASWISINRDFNGEPGIAEFPDSRLRLHARSWKATDYAIAEGEPARHNLEEERTYNLIEDPQGDIEMNGSRFIDIGDDALGPMALTARISNGKLVTRRNIEHIPRRKTLYLVDSKKAADYGENPSVKLGLNEYIIFENAVPQELADDSARIVKTDGAIYGDLEKLGFAETIPVGALEVIGRIAASRKLYWIKFFNEIRTRMLAQEDRALQFALEEGRGSATYNSFLLMRIPDHNDTDQLMDPEKEFRGSRSHVFNLRDPELVALLPERYRL